jgi:arginase
MILYLGIRDIDIFEREMLERYNIQYISCDELNNFDKRTIKKIDQFIDNYPVHFSFDVDSLDPSFIESTGTPVDKGLDPYKFLNMANQTKMKKNIVNMDLVEFNPDLQSNPYKLFRELEIIKSIYHNFI